MDFPSKFHLIAYHSFKTAILNERLYVVFKFWCPFLAHINLNLLLWRSTEHVDARIFGFFVGLSNSGPHIESNRIHLVQVVCKIASEHKNSISFQLSTFCRVDQDQLGSLKTTATISRNLKDTFAAFTLDHSPFGTSLHQFLINCQFVQNLRF